MWSQISFNHAMTVLLHDKRSIKMTYYYFYSIEVYSNCVWKYISIHHHNRLYCVMLYYSIPFIIDTQWELLWNLVF